MLYKTILDEKSNEKISHISNKPWGDYTQADYTLQQWHDACLIHIHDGPNYTKNDCKLPVKTPNGAINRNGVHAAAAALAGARNPIKASPEEIAKAKASLRKIYDQMGDMMPPSLIQSDMTLDILEHHGIKGQKWGVRRAAKKAAKADKKFEAKTIKEMSSTATFIKLHNYAADQANKHDVDRINNKPEYKNKDFTHDSPLRRKYYKEHEDAFNKRVLEGGRKMFEGRVNPSGTKKIHIDNEGNAFFVDIKHSNNEPSIVIHKDNMGHIISFELVLPKEMGSEMMQIDSVPKFLEHHGIKGQKWGVRRNHGLGKGSHDFKKARELRSRGAHNLSNKQLDFVNKRLNLESNFHRLNPTKIAQGLAIATSILAAADIGTRLYNHIKGPAGQAAIKAGKKFMTKKA